MTTKKLRQQDDKRVILVTGAGCVLGQAICKAWAQTGAIVFATDDRPFTSHKEVIGLTCDFRSRQAIQAVVAECENAGGINVLVNCTQMQPPQDVFEMSVEDWDAVFAENVLRPILYSQAVARSMTRQRKPGCIVQIGSLHAEKVMADSVAYCSSMGALAALSRSMALSLAPSRIRVNTVAPGARYATDSETGHGPAKQAGAFDFPGAIFSDSDIASSVSAAVMFLASDDSRFITGVTLYVDGGRQAGI